VVQQLTYRYGWVDPLVGRQMFRYGIIEIEEAIFLQAQKKNSRHRLRVAPDSEYHVIRNGATSKRESCTWRIALSIPQNGCGYSLNVEALLYCGYCILKFLRQRLVCGVDG
jgi:hypothetical protein